MAKKEGRLSGNKVWWQPIVHFAGHTLAGTIMFILFGAVSVVLAMLVQYLEASKVPVFTLAVLSFVEHVILIVDSVLYLIYLAVAGWEAVKEIVE
jgi:hypothetical protein